jgi:5-formyltetrahydrofolate cyclo-ligase
MDKGELRELVVWQRTELTTEWLAEASGAVLENLVVQSAFEEASFVACYLDVDSEVRTSGILERCWADGKTVCVPAYDAAMESFRMAQIRVDTEMINGQMNISEPAHPRWIDVGDVDLFLVPGLAFDAKGGRVGYGGGCYDRIMSGARGVKAALAFDFQVFEQVPVEEHDILLNMIITETRIITVS